MVTLAWSLLAASATVVVYAYVAYPVLLWLIGWVAWRRPAPADPAQWPMITVSIPAYNEELAIATTLEHVLASDYPADRRQVMVISDASTDRTHEIVRSFEPRGVELLVMPQRRGKTAVENAALPHVRGEIVVNTDASVALHPGAIRALVRAFADPTVGLASSRDVSGSNVGDTANVGEACYVGYEMWVRDQETRVWGIVGASGSLYAIRADLHKTLIPEELERDFAAAMIAREHGYRSVSVANAICYVPPGTSLHREFRRKQRTMTRAIETLWYKRHLLNPFRYGMFALMLISHKVVRWFVPCAVVTMLAALVPLAWPAEWARLALAAAAVVATLGLVGWLWPTSKPLPRLLALPAYVCSGLVAALGAWIRVLSGEKDPVWEPTRRALVRIDR
jgi:cellulose synthase/poly-beta-1,6-N-acetylglucosamine synthase-like glycosyltransferase